MQEESFETPKKNVDLVCQNGLRGCSTSGMKKGREKGRKDGGAVQVTGVYNKEAKQGH